VTSISKMGIRARAVDVGSPADMMLLLLEATREMVCSSGLVKESCREIASRCAAVRNVAKAYVALAASGSASSAAARAVAVPPISASLVVRGSATLKKAPM
jgi:hypothetical protein